MNMSGATLNPAAGGPVGGGMIMMNNQGGSPAVSSERNPEQIKIMLNTYVYEYFLKLRCFDIARALHKDEKFEFRTNSKQSPGHRKDGDLNGVDNDSMDADMKDDIPDDLPRPAGGGADSSMQGNGFLFEWFSVFSDLFAAHRNPHKAGGATPAMQYLVQHQQLQRMRESQQNQTLARPGGMMNPNFMRNQQMRNGMVNGEMRKGLTPQQLQLMQQQNKAQQMQQMARGDQPEGDPNARPATPADGENGGSPSKRPRLDGAQQFNAGMIPNGRPGVPGVGQQGMMIQAGFNPNMNQAQFRQNGGMPPKAMAANMANGMNMMPNAGSPMMQNMAQFPEGANMDIYQNRMAAAQAMQGVPNGQSGNHALQDYQMQLMLLEQQNKKRLMMARQEQHDSTNPRDGQPMAGGVNMQPPGMSPGGSRTGTSPNPTDQMKRTPQLGGMPGSPSAGDMQGRSPAPMNFMNGIQPQDFNPAAMFMKDGQMMGPGGPGMRPPTSVDMNAMQRAQQQAQQQQPQQQQARMQFPGGQPMQQQTSQGQTQPVGTPGQRNEMPPPQAPAANNSAQRGNQPASPANSNAPPTPSQASKPSPKNKKAANKDGPDRKRPNKKNSTANAPNTDDNPTATPTASTPITPVHAGPFNNVGGKGPNQGAQQNNQQAQQNAGMPSNQQPMAAPDLQSNGFDFGAQDPNFNLDFSTLENSDVLENFDFDSFLNTSNDDAPFNFDGGMDNFTMDPNDG